MLRCKKIACKLYYVVCFLSQEIEYEMKYYTFFLTMKLFTELFLLLCFRFCTYFLILQEIELQIILLVSDLTCNKMLTR